MSVTAKIYQFPPKTPNYLLNKNMDLFIAADKIFIEAQKIYNLSKEIAVKALLVQVELLLAMSGCRTKH